METLLLKDEEVKPLLSIEEIMEAVEEAFKEKGLGSVQMPPKPYLFFGKYDGGLRVMPSCIKRIEMSQP